MGRKCAVYSCLRKRSERLLKFFCFPHPRYPDVINKWRQACNNPNLFSEDAQTLHKNYRVCSIHFEPKYLLHKTLKRGSVPTLHLKLNKATNKENVHSRMVVEESTGRYENIPTNYGTLPGKTCRTIGTQTEVQHSSASTQTTNIETNKQILENKWSTQTQTSFELSLHSPRKLELKKKIQIQTAKIKKLKNENKRRKLESEFITNKKQEENVPLSQFIKACDNHLPSFLGNITKEIAGLIQHKKRGRRYSLQLKQYALSLMYSSPRTYKRIIKKFDFPSVSTLRRMTYNIQQGPGFQDYIFKNLELKMKGKQPIDRLCILIMDEMSLKSNLFYDVRRDEVIGLQNLGGGNEPKVAEHALVLMARGIDEKWKQQLAYFFINTSVTIYDLKKIIEDCIQRLTKAGLDVRALISDLGSNFNRFSKLMGVTKTQTYFQVDGKKIFYIFDPPHLIKVMRNTLLKYDIVFEEKEASWKHIKEMYELEKENNLKMVTKLTQIHIDPNNFQKMRVKYATQVLSSTVAAAITSCMSKGLIEAKAIGTVNFIEKMDKTFDMLNSSTSQTKNQYKKPYKATKPQIKYLRDMLISLKDMRVYDAGKVDITNRFRGMKCFQISINSIMQLFEDLKQIDVKELKTRRLNQDCVENFFGKIRQQQGNAVNPTPIQFTRAFKKLACLDFLDTIDTFNCEPDLDETLLQQTLNNYTGISDCSIKCPFQIKNTEFQEDNFLQKNVESYIAGYIIKKCLKRHTCDICENYSHFEHELDENKLFTFFKGSREKYGKTEELFGKLRMPKQNFINYVSSLESSFNENIYLTKGKVMEELFEELKRIPFIHPCPQFPAEYALKLFIRMRIYYTVKFANTKIKEDSIHSRRSKKNRKLSILKHL